MSDSGGTTGTPISGGGGPSPVASLLTNPLPYTLLSISRYAQNLGINPIHFWGADCGNINPQIMPVRRPCSDIYAQYSWQNNDAVSRYDIALEIQNAEEDVAKILGYYPAPTWISEEKLPYPQFHRRELYGIGLEPRGRFKAITTSFGRVTSVGKRAVSLVGIATTGAGSLDYLDEDSDGFYETALVSLPTSLTNTNELKVYHAGYSGQQEWEIREPRRKYISGGYIYFIFDSWLFINPELFEVYITEDGNRAIDIGTTNTNFVTSVEVYREYADPTDDSVMFYWENVNVGCAICNGEGCEACGTISQEGCLRIRDSRNGILSAVPATYNNGEWEIQSWTGSREPDRMSIWYCAGEESNSFKSGRTVSPLSNHMAQIITWIATARLDRPLCGCGNVTSIVESLQIDITKNVPGVTFFNPIPLLDNPLGTHYGEIRAWRRLKNHISRRTNVAVL